MRNKEDTYIVLKAGVFAILDCNENGKLLKKYVIAEYRYSQESQEIFSICSCGDNTCLHIREFHSLLLGPADDYITEQTEDYVCEFLSESLVGVYCQREQAYGVLRTAVTNTCLTCLSNVRNCPHIYVFMGYMVDNDHPPRIREQESFKAYSTKLIPYLLYDNHDLEVFNGYISNQKKYPTHLYPDDNQSLKCIHEHLFNEEVIKLRDGFLHLPYHTQEVSIYYQVSTGSCKCHLNYDGNSDLLFNVDNKHIFPF